MSYDIDVAEGLLSARQTLARREWHRRRDSTPNRKKYKRHYGMIRRGTKQLLHREAYICMTETESASKSWRVRLAGTRFVDDPRVG